MGIKTVPFDMIELMLDEAAIHEYLRQVVADGDAAEIVRALRHVAHARGMIKLADDSGLSREELYNAVKPDATPSLNTMLRLFAGLGIRLTAVPVNAAPKPSAKGGKRRRAKAA